MAYPKESEHVDYLQYLERWSNGEESGPKLSKEEWRKRQKKGGRGLEIKAKAGNGLTIPQ